ncbi:MAG TPA: hypothetical protein VFU15_14455, partial [Bacteroidia bacterium]|nr:hypothetical protein [Bacteroidia bacterium]
KALLKVLKATFQKLGYEVCHSTGETPDAGGNWQRFEINRKIITVAGRPSVSDGPPLPQKPDDLPPIHIWDEKLCPFADNFFHLDNYFQWIGNMDNAIASKAEPNEGYYFLASQSHYPEDFPHPGNGALDKAIHKAVNLFNEQVCQLGASPMAIPLPVMLFPMGSPVKGGPEEACNDIYHFLSMSYVNCIVENYMTDTGWRIVNVYLPDFRESLEEIHRQSINQNIPLTQSDFRKGISPLWEVVYGEQLADDKITKESLENFIYSVQHKIAAGLYRLGFTNVCFVRHRFHALSHKRGALHCITKIV